MTIIDILKDVLFLHISMKNRATKEELSRVKKCITWLVMNADEESEKTYDLWKEMEQANNIPDLKRKYQNNDISTIEEGNNDKTY